MSNKSENQHPGPPASPVATCPRLTHAPCSADLVYLSNIGSTILDTDAFAAVPLLAASFKTGPSQPAKSGPHRVGEVTVHAQCVGAPCTMRLSVWSTDPGTHAPKALLWALTRRVDTSPSGLASFRPANPWLLAPEAGYAVVLQALGRGSVGQWAYSDRANFTAAPGWQFVGWGSSDNGELRRHLALLRWGRPCSEAACLQGACPQLLGAT